MWLVCQMNWDPDSRWREGRPALAFSEESGTFNVKDAGF